MENDEFRFIQFRTPRRVEDTRRRPVPMGYLNLVDAADKQQQRDWVANELEKIFQMHGNPLKKGSLEIEGQLYDKSRNQEEYMTLAHRLLRHMREMAIRRNSKPESTQCSDRKSTLPTNDSPTEKVNSALVFPVPSVFPSSPPSALSETPGDLQDPPLPPPHLSYGSVRLPAPNKRTFATSTTEEYPPNPFSRLRERLPEPTNEEAPEILTRLVREDEEDPLSASDLSSDTYETSFKFLVPTNSVIKQITIHLKQRK